MLWIDLIWAFLLALLFALLLAGPLRWRHPSRSGGAVPLAAVFLFTIFFLAIWAGGRWLAPIGPPLWGGYWLSFLLVGLFVLLLLATVSPPAPPPPPRTPAEVHSEIQKEEAAGTVLSVFFLLLLVALIVAILLSYIEF